MTIRVFAFASCCALNRRFSGSADRSISIYSAGMPVTFAVPSATHACALGLLIKPSTSETDNLREPVMLKALLHLQSAPSLLRALQPDSALLLHRESFPKHLPAVEAVKRGLSQRQSEPSAVRRLHLACPLPLHLESFPKHLPAACAPLSSSHLQSAPCLPSNLQVDWVLCLQRESLPTHSPVSAAGEVVPEIVEVEVLVVAVVEVVTVLVRFAETSSLLTTVTTLMFLG